MVHTLITGASSGLGKACVDYFEAKGHKVITIQHRRQCNFNDKIQVEREAQNIANVSPDLIIHCAGGGFGLKDDLLSWDDFETLFRVNVVAPAIINKYVVPSMIERGHGNIIHIASIAGRQTGASVGYSTVKAGVLAYVRTLGRNLASTGVVVTGIIPGSFVAEGNNWDRYINKDAPFLKEYIKTHCPRGRLGKVEELLPMIDFLTSPQASIMCGCCVPIDGGEGVTYP